ncbi:MAG TPA: SRPBCC domain-containing protein [Gammaproteobacteria bacterium]|nr:SRPBCC domain-containing protein [Gammaproteobacteria bacterium]
MKDGTQQSVTLVVRQTVQAPPREVYAAWTEPAHLKEWWGPEGVACIGAEMDLRVGGAYRIGNRFPDGKVIWLAGSFEAIEPPRLLMYTWGVEPAPATERVTVRFEARGNGTEVIVTHERIASPALRDMHRQGWEGCLVGLADYLSGSRAS